MSNIQDKIGRGLFKIQESIDKGKSKVDVMKETALINKSIEELCEKKLYMLIKLGMTAHKKISEGSLCDEDMKATYKSIVGFDYMICENRKKIEEIIKENQGFECDCGNILNENIKFCNKCGKKVEKKKEDENHKNCINCDMNIPEESIFCPCCGIKLN